MYNDLISVIVPVYKVEMYLEKCLDSIINQTYKNIEIILIDDGSPDNCGAICDKYAKKDKRIKVIHKENEGVSIARNTGIDICKGQYITFIDSDDWVEKEYIYELYHQCRNNNADISISNVEDFNENTQEIIRNFSEIKLDLNQENLCKELMLERYFSCVVWGKMYKIQLFQDIRFNKDTKIAEDLEVLYEVIKKSEKANINTYNYLYHYTIRNGSTMAGKFNEDFEKEIDITQKIIDDVKKIYPNVENYGIQRYVRKNLANAIRLMKEKEIEDKESKIKSIKKNIKQYKYIFLSEKLVRRNDKIKFILFMINWKLLNAFYKMKWRRI